MSLIQAETMATGVKEILFKYFIIRSAKIINLYCKAVSEYVEKKTDNYSDIHVQTAKYLIRHTEELVKYVKKTKLNSENLLMFKYEVNKVLDFVNNFLKEKECDGNFLKIYCRAFVYYRFTVFDLIDSNNLNQIKSITDSNQKKSAISVVQWNANGIGKKKMEIVNFILKENVHIFIIQEKREKAEFKLFGYTSFNKNKKSSSGGGLLLLVKDEIYEDIEEIEMETFKPENKREQIQAVKIRLKSYDFTIFNVYNPRKTNVDLNLKVIKEKLTNYSMVAGDFNGVSPRWVTGSVNNSIVNKIEKFQKDSNLILLNERNKKPTYFPFDKKKNPSILDLTYVTPALDKKIHSWDVVDERLESDHKMIKMILDNT